MFTVSDVVAVLRDCEAIFASVLLTDDEKTGLSEQVLQSLPDPSFSPCAPSVRIIQAAVRRHKELQVGRSADPVTPEKQGRKTKGVKKPAEVAPEEAPGDQASEGSPEGVPEQA